MSKTNKSLGRGLDALFGSSPHDISALTYSNEHITQLSLDDIEPTKDQPRRQFDQKGLEEMAVSIKEFGVLQPLVVVHNEQNKYSIIAGERRWRASRIAGLSKVPVIVRTATELEKLELALIENVQREDLTPLDQAVSILRLHDQFSLSYETIAGKLGKAYSTVANLVRLLQLPQPIQAALQNKQITEGHARALLSLQSDPEKQEVLFQLIVSEHLSVRQAEQYVVANRDGLEKAQDQRQRMAIETPDTKKLSHHLGSMVTVHHMAKGGKLSVRFKTAEEYDALVRRLMNS